MSTRYQLIELLADGRFRSGQWLGQQLGISRAAVWKQIGMLAEMGLEVHAVRGQGYRLVESFEPLNPDRICLAMQSGFKRRLERLDILHEVDSTSDYLKRNIHALDERRVNVCIAERQSAGRGRRGRRWISPYGTNIYLSLAASLSEASVGAGGVSLVAAIAVAVALERCGVSGLGVKWPNDIYYQGRKLAGILLDLSGESGGPYRIVIGVGINLKMPAAAAEDIDQPWADLSQAGIGLDRNYLAGLIIEGLMDTLDLFNEHGFDAFTQEWNRLDLVSGQAVVLHHERQCMVSGVARGIDSSGALLIERNGETRSYHAGEVSLRLS